MLIGYMRVSSESDRQSTDLQRDALLAAGVDGRHLFEDHASGATDDRPGLVKALAFVQPGDVLVVWKLDRLGRSLSHLLSIVNALKEKRWPSVRSPKAWIPRRRRASCCFMCSARCPVRACPDTRAGRGGVGRRPAPWSCRRAACGQPGTTHELPAAQSG